MRRLSDRYTRPVAELERLFDAGALAHEIAILLADSIIEQARHFRALPTDKAAREALRKERTRIKHSNDWFDRLIAARMAHDAAQEAKP